MCVWLWRPFEEEEEGGGTKIRGGYQFHITVKDRRRNLIPTLLTTLVPRIRKKENNNMAVGEKHIFWLPF